MNRATAKRARVLIVTECANCISGGYCALADRPCMQIVEMRKPSDGNKVKLCRWFRNAVLPTVPALQAEITGKTDGGAIHKCASCGQPILTATNRQRYCQACGKVNRRRTHAAVMRNFRAK